MQCIFCKHKKYKPVANSLRDSDKHRVVKCLRCQLVQLDPTPTLQMDQQFYDRGLQAKNIGLTLDLKNLKQNQANDTTRRADWVSSVIQPSSTILDIGSGYGFFLAEMEKRKFNPVGIEISQTSRTIAKKITNAKILTVNMLKDKLTQKFDAITLFHVLEHIAQPVKFLKRIRNLLKDNGKIFIEVPNLDDWMLKTNRAYRNFYWQRAHLSYFNETMLQKIILQAGFQNFKISFIQRYGLDNLFNWKYTGKPELNKPSMQIQKNYVWLENLYKNSLTTSKQSDTIILVAIKSGEEQK